MLSTLNVISATHNSCEDSLLVKEDYAFIAGGVFDGCSTGVKSHWASQTFSHIFSDCLNPTNDSEIFTAKEIARDIKSWLSLTEMNFLSTCVLFSYNKKTLDLHVRVFGDGFYFVNGKEYAVEQDNTPDYMGYHLDSSDEKFKDYLNKYPTRSYENVTDFKVCSDGIKSIGISQFHPSDIDPLARLLAAPTSENFLQRQWNILKKNKFTISDDLSIISYVQD